MGDVSTIIRARNCTGDGADNVCETLYVDDYRYETGLLVSDIVQWYRVVAALRIIGQSYFFIRVIGLILSCYYAYSTPTSRPGLSGWSRLRKATSLFMNVPTQCVVYGSPFPVACYVLAHVLDAPFTYQILRVGSSRPVGFSISVSGSAFPTQLSRCATFGFTRWAGISL